MKEVAWYSLKAQVVTETKKAIQCRRRDDTRLFWIAKSQIKALKCPDGSLKTAKDIANKMEFDSLEVATFIGKRLRLKKIKEPV